MSYTWFTSDPHFGHQNIIKYCDRPFKDINHMNETIANNINERTATNDTLFSLGDWCFTGRAGGDNKPLYWEKRLNPKIVHIRGNHDKNNYLRGALECAIIKLSTYNVLLQHRPPQHPKEIPDFVDFVICGHVHQLYRHTWIKTDNDDCMIINVGVDAWNFYPVRMDEVIGFYEKHMRDAVSDRTYIVDNHTVK